MAENDSYPGNPALPQEGKDKIVSTFRHAINLYKEGKREDCAVGCDFILKMDPRFAPARQLLEAARNPAAAVDVASLETLAASLANPAAPGGNPEPLIVEALEAFSARDFNRAIDRANRALAIAPTNADARGVLDKARWKRDLQPHLENFHQRALFALEAGQMDEARLNVDRVRNLDPDHPALPELEKRLSASSTPPAAAPRITEEAAPVTPAPEVPPPVFAPAPTPEPPVFSNDLWGPAPTFEAPHFEPPAAPATASAPAPAFEPAAADQRVARIAELLGQGDDLAAQGNSQGAIEAWSQIFLLDLNNSEAAARIEKARSAQAEGNRRVTDALRTGRDLYDAGKLKEAREKFLEVLAIDEGEPTARNYLQRIEEGLARPAPPRTTPGLYDLSNRTAGRDPLAEEELVVPPLAAPADAEQSAEKSPAAGSRPGKKPSLLSVAIVILVAAIAAGLYFVTRGSSSSTTPPAAAPSGAAIIHARALFKQGKVAEARQALAGIPATDPQYGYAQKLLATFRTSPEPAAASPPATSTAPATAANPAAARAQGEAALAAHNYISALEAFNECGSAYANDVAFNQEMSQAQTAVAAISPAVKMYNAGDYDSALALLWRLNQNDGANEDVKSYLVRCYYNQGIAALENGNFSDASKDFQEALGVNPADQLSRRQKSFADRYITRSQDLLARIYIKYLRTRP